VTHPKARFVVVGPPDLDKADAISQGEIDRAPVDAGVRFLGMREDVERLYPAMDLYVLASHREGFPRSAMEAAAMGLPIVATDIRGCRQVVDHGVRAARRRPRPDALAEAIGELVAAAELRRTMGDAGRQKAVAEFDDRQQVRTTLAVYERELGRVRRRRDRRSAYYVGIDLSATGRGATVGTDRRGGDGRHGPGGSCVGRGRLPGCRPRRLPR
jgi:glycosyltransferase involved in cell wall biosynthesis